jgi:hypothetical protein
METKFKNPKLDVCKDELRALLLKLLNANYHTIAETVFDHIAHTGVETELDTSLKNEPTLVDFLESK